MGAQQTVAKFYLTKPIRREDLISTIQKALVGEKDVVEVLPDKIVHKIRSTNVALNCNSLIHEE